MALTPEHHLPGQAEKQFDAVGLLPARVEAEAGVEAEAESDKGRAPGA